MPRLVRARPGKERPVGGGEFSRVVTPVAVLGAGDGDGDLLLRAVARWLADVDARDALAGCFAPPLTELERAIAEREGWILGVM